MGSTVIPDAVCCSGEIIGEHRVKFVFVDETFVAKIARHGTLQAVRDRCFREGNKRGEARF